MFKSNIKAYITLKAENARVRDVVVYNLFTPSRKNGAKNPPTLQPINSKLLAIRAAEPLENLATSANKYGIDRDCEKAKKNIAKR